MSENDKLTCISDIIPARSAELPQEIMDLLMKDESIVADLELESALHPACVSPSTIPINPNMEENIALDFQDNNFVVDELQNCTCSISACTCLHNSKNNQESESPTSDVTERVFDVPLLGGAHLYCQSKNIKNETENSNIQNDCEVNQIVKSEVKEETNSDSTIEYLMDDICEWRDEKHEPGNNATISLPGMQSFSPLPSTSRDYATMNINDMMFNGTEEIKEESNSPKLSNKRLINRKKRLPTEDLNIVECSSGSENADDEVVICNEIKPNIIDLSVDDAKYDSDCEIVDVDSILDVNKKVLNTTKITSTSSQNKQIDSVDLNESVNIISSTEPMVKPIQLPATPEVQVIQDVEQIDSSTPLSNSFFPFLSSLNSFFNCPVADNQIEMEDVYNKISQSNQDTNLQHNTENVTQQSVENIFQGNLSDENFLSLYPPFFNTFPDEAHRRKLKKRNEHTSKRRRVGPVIDLSVTSSLAHNSSDVVIIDADSPVNFQSNNNPAQISVSIVTQTSCSINSSTHQFIEQSTHIPNPIRTSSPIPLPPKVESNFTSESSSKTPPRGLGDCPVCLENFSKVKAVSTFCGHLFCIDCITTVKRSSKKCPTCRKYLKGKGYHPIFL